MRMMWFAAAAWAAAGAAAAGEFPARLEWADRVELSTPVPGTVQEVLVEPGAVVSRGAPLLKLDPAIYQARVQQGEALVARAKEEAAEAHRDLARTQELYNRTVLSTSELDRAKLRAAQADSRLAEETGKLAEARRNLQDTVLTAPFDAVVLARSASPGTTVAPGLQPPALVTAARADRMLARALLKPEEAARLTPGRSATVKVAGRQHAGTVSAITAAEGAYAADVAFTPARGYKAGMQASVVLP